MLEERVLPVSADRLFSVKTPLAVTDLVASALLDVALEFMDVLLDEFTDDDSFDLSVLALLLLELPFSTTPELLLLDSLELRYAFVPVVLLP